MRAVTIRDGELVLAEHADPAPGLGQILVAVQAAGLNNADLLQRAGQYDPPADSPPDIPGMEFAGEVIDVGPGVSRFKRGDRAMALVGGGAQAELAVAHETVALKVPKQMQWPQAGSFPEVFATAHDALFTQCQLGLGEKVLITGAAGGVGTAAVQMATAAGAEVIASVRNPDRRAEVAELGAVAIAPEDLKQHGPYDVILEMFPHANLEAGVANLAMGGRIHLVSLVGGPIAELNVARLMFARGTIRASTMRARPLEAKADVMNQLAAHVLPLIESGRLHVPVVSTYPLSKASDAYAAFASGGKFGKIVLVPEKS